MIQQSRSVPDEQKALYHQVLGAGRRRVKREFLGLNEADKAAITERLGVSVRDQLRKGA